MGLAETAELAVRISLKDNASAGIRRLQGNLGGLSSSVGRVGRGFGQIGTGLARAGLLVGGAAITGIGLAAKAAIDFEDAFAGVRKTVNEADLIKVGLSFDILSDRFREMSTEIPIAATELARIGETAGALGIRAQDIESFTRTVALLSETTNLSVDEAAESLGKLGTILGLTGDEFTDVADTIVNLGNQGASTESEIVETAKRFAAIGRQAGLANDEILGLSSSVTSLGAEPEAGGSALSRIFANMSTEIANATDKGKTFSKITGDSLEELKKRINQGDALGIVLETLKGISGLSRTKAASVLKALGITNVRDRNAILLMAQNLGFVKDQLEIAEHSQGALAKEAEKRFDTARSKLILMKNAAEDLGRVFGIQVLPSIKRVAKQATEFLKDPDIKADAKALGDNVASFIDNINWDDVKKGAQGFVDLLKSAADWAGKILGIIDKLPGEVKAAAGAFLVLNKLSGGLIGQGVGNVVGGIAETVVRAGGSKLPGIGKLFAQPVFVTNWPMGGLGGGGTAVAGAAKGGIGVLGKLFLVGEAIGLIAAVNDVKNSVQAGWKEQTTQIGTDLNNVIAKQDPAALQLALAGIDEGLAKLNAQTKPGGEPSQLLAPVIAELQKQREQVVAAIRAQTAQEKTSREDAPADEQRRQQRESRRASQAAATIAAGLAGIFGRRIKWEPSDVIQVEDRRAVTALAAAAHAKTDREERMPAEELKALARVSQSLDVVKGAVKAAGDRAQVKYDRIRDRIEAHRIATQNQTDRQTTKMDNIRAAEQTVRDKVESNRIATQTGLSNVRSAEQVAADRIVAAIRSLDLSVAVHVSGSSGSSYQSNFLNSNKPKPPNP